MLHAKPRGPLPRGYIEPVPRWHDFRRMPLRSVSSLRFGLSSHAQTTTTFHPASRHKISFFVSRAMFRFSFSFQKRTFDFGTRASSHPSWWCQKHPRTSIIVLCFFITTSGCPGMDFECKRKRKPRLCSHERVMSSGFVSFDLIRLITRQIGRAHV